jgi:hypothetical protein
MAIDRFHIATDATDATHTSRRRPGFSQLHAFNALKVVTHVFSSSD